MSNDAVDPNAPVQDGTSTTSPPATSEVNPDENAVETGISARNEPSGPTLNVEMARLFAEALKQGQRHKTARVAILSVAATVSIIAVGFLVLTAESPWVQCLGFLTGTGGVGLVIRKQSVRLRAIYKVMHENGLAGFELFFESDHEELEVKEEKQSNE